MEARQIDTDRSYTREEYFELLKGSLHKYEYLDGQVRLMAGGTVALAEIVDNTFLALGTGRHRCKVKSDQTAVLISSLNRYFFPDISAVCEEKPIYESQTGIARITNPALIVEVLSENTADYDRTEKFSAYRELPSSREFVLIDSRRCYVETFFREHSNLWHIANYHRMDHSVSFRTLSIEVPLATIYNGIDFDSEH